MPGGRVSVIFDNVYVMHAQGVFGHVRRGIANLDGGYSTKYGGRGIRIRVNESISERKR